jgi:AcrR family transcriptional regulator
VTGRSKTKEKILRTALGLFNNEGESQVSSVDIASVMGISPGNLYYHYKGKDEIIVELFADIIFEEIFDFRFFYKNQSDIIDRNPVLRHKFSRILALKEETALSLLSTLEAAGHVEFGEGEKAALSTRIAQHFTFWLQYHDLRFGEAAPKSLIDAGVFATLVQITPYWTHGKGYSDLLKEFVSGRN